MSFISCCCAEPAENSFQLIPVTSPAFGTFSEAPAAESLRKADPPVAASEKETDVPATGAASKEPVSASGHEISSCPPKAVDHKPFTVKLTKPSNGILGWRLDCVGSQHIYIFTVTESQTTPIALHNASAPEESRIQMGDYISSVNGTNGVSGMVEIIDNCRSLEVTVCRPRIFTAKVKRNESLGLELKYWPSATSLLIGEIRPGAVTKQCVDLLADDRILDVNGVSGSVGALLAAVREAEELEFRIARCPMLYQQR